MHGLKGPVSERQAEGVALDPEWRGRCEVAVLKIPANWLRQWERPAERPGEVTRSRPHIEEAKGPIRRKMLTDQ